MVEISIRELALIVAGAGLSGIVIDLINRTIPQISQTSKAIVMFGGLLGYYYFRKYTGIRKYLSDLLLGLGVSTAGDITEGIFRTLIPL
ncbi:MAG: hypothetical protein QXX03_08390 [Nitrososphaerota archaeon]